MALLVRAQEIEQFPLFVDYGQRNKDREFAACKANLERHGLPEPAIAEMAGFGKLIPSGLTSNNLRVFEDAFLPCRNLMFLMTGAAYAYRKGAHGVAIGLLDERQALFPDQTSGFLDMAKSLLSVCLDRPVEIAAPFIHLSKAEVYEQAVKLGISGTYSCHIGDETPCGFCIACREYSFLGGGYGRRR
jgi:7-cyano-7-deazaguanine synthase